MTHSDLLRRAEELQRETTDVGVAALLAELISTLREESPASAGDEAVERVARATVAEERGSLTSADRHAAEEQRYRLLRMSEHWLRGKRPDFCNILTRAAAEFTAAIRAAKPEVKA